jgi:hypothetical protein
MYTGFTQEEEVPDGGGGGIPGFQLMSLIILSVASILGLIIVSWKKTTLN